MSNSSLSNPVERFVRYLRTTGEKTPVIALTNRNRMQVFSDVHMANKGTDPQALVDMSERLAERAQHYVETVGRN